MKQFSVESQMESKGICFGGSPATPEQAMYLCATLARALGAVLCGGTGTGLC